MFALTTDPCMNHMLTVKGEQGAPNECIVYKGAVWGAMCSKPARQNESNAMWINAAFGSLVCATYV